MTPAPLPADEAERLNALRQYDILDTAREDVYDDVVRLAAFACRTPLAALTLLDADRQWFKSVLGSDARETPRDVAFCAHALFQAGLLVVPDARKDRGFADNPHVTGRSPRAVLCGAPRWSRRRGSSWAPCASLTASRARSRRTSRRSCASSPARSWPSSNSAGGSSCKSGCSPSGNGSLWSGSGSPWSGRRRPGRSGGRRASSGRCSRP